MMGLDHLGFTVADIKRSTEFYTLLLRQEPIIRGRFSHPFVSKEVGYENVELDVAFYDLANTDTKLELLEYRNPRGTKLDMETCNPGNGHFCLMVEDLESEFQRLTAAGIRFRQDQPVEVPIGPFRGGKVAYFRDPDEISVQLLEPPEGGPRYYER